MSGQVEQGIYRREVSPGERLFVHSPSAIVSIILKINGNVSADALQAALAKAKQRHRNLRVRIEEDSDGFWFTSENVEPFQVNIIARERDDQWLQEVKTASKTPFHFDRQPPIRFILLQSETVSELIIACHHILCDGLSLAYLSRDIMMYLGAPDMAVEALPDANPIGLDMLPDDVSLNGIAKFFVNRINKKWNADSVTFDQQDYLDLHEAYWQNFSHAMVTATLTEAQTTALVKRCKEEGVTVNSALSAAFAGAQSLVLGPEKYQPSMGIAGNLRNRSKDPVGEQMGFYAGVVTLDFDYQEEAGFWENARHFHKKIIPMYTNKKLFADFLAWSYLAPGILEAINFKKLGGLVSPEAARYQKISEFSKKNDVVLSILKREKSDSLDRIIMGASVTNLTRLDFARQFGDLELEALYFKAGGAFPLSNINLLAGVATTAGKLTMVLEFSDQVLSTETVEKIKKKTVEILLES